MRKSDTRLEFEAGSLHFYRRLHERSPSAAFEAIAQKMLDLEWELINVQSGVEGVARSLEIHEETQYGVHGGEK